METVFKITNENMTTFAGYLWQQDVTAKLDPVGDPRLCSGDVFHAYESIEQACILSASHLFYANGARLILWKATTSDIVAKSWDKVGVFDLTLREKIEFPEWYTDWRQFHAVLEKVAVAVWDKVQEQCFTTAYMEREASLVLKGGSLLETQHFVYRMFHMLAIGGVDFHEIIEKAGIYD